MAGREMAPRGRLPDRARRPTREQRHAQGGSGLVPTVAFGNPSPQAALHRLPPLEPPRARRALDRGAPASRLPRPVAVARGAGGQAIGRVRRAGVEPRPPARVDENQFGAQERPWAHSPCRSATPFSPAALRSYLLGRVMGDLPRPEQLHSSRGSDHRIDCRDRPGLAIYSDCDLGRRRVHDAPRLARTVASRRRPEHGLARPLGRPRSRSRRGATDPPRLGRVVDEGAALAVPVEHERCLAEPHRPRVRRSSPYM